MVDDSFGYADQKCLILGPHWVRLALKWDKLGTFSDQISDVGQGATRTSGHNLYIHHATETSAFIIFNLCEIVIESRTTY